MEVQSFIELCGLSDTSPLSLDELLLLAEDREPVLKCDIVFPF
ncbi:hypothetical protein [Sphingobacterium faecale]|nr:hypothetical protein [Sphingobacterium faecale]